MCMLCGERFCNAGWECPSCHVGPGLVGGYPAFSPDLAEDNECFNADYFGQLADIESHNFWFRSRNRLIIWALRRYFPKAKNLFEIGCGTGFVLSGIKDVFPGMFLYGSDIYVDSLDYAKKRAGDAELFQMDACKIPFDNEFDVIGAFDLLEHIKKDELALSQMHKAVHDSGGIILTVPQHTFLWSQTDEYACHVRRYKARELKTKVEEAGFKVVDMISFVSLLLPVMMISRLKKRLLNKEYDIMTELKLDTLTNAVLEKVQDVERGLIRLGIRLPFGGSLLIVAYKNSTL